MRHFFLLALLGILLAGIPAVSATAAEAAPETEAKPKLELPRFGALRFAAVNLRTGPGTRYPMTWVYKRAGLPVEVIALFDTWYRIRDYEGTEGWVHKTQVKLQRRGMIIGTKPHDARAAPEATAPVTAHLMPLVQFNLVSCSKDWCLAKSDDFKGYLRKDAFFGAYPAEVFE